MITIKKPIALHTNMTLSCDTGGFAQRMKANYDMMGTTVKPKELLFFVTAPMELPEEWMGAQTSLNLSTHVQNNQAVSLSVTNNLINRILLEHNTPFTYQDTVYISSVLRQLGVEEVSHFISEVRRLRKEQTSAHTISKLYEKVNQTDMLQTLIRQERETLHKTTEQKGAAPQRDESRDNYLFQHIFNRLDSKTIYQGVHAFQGHIRQSEFNPTQAQLRLTEHIRTSQALERTELRTNFLGKQQLTLEHVTNLYEQGDGLPVPQTQDQVLSQITQATLMHMVTQALSQELVYNKVQKQQWVNFERTIAQMAEHSLARYQAFHSQPISHSHHHNQHTAVQQAMTAVEIEQLQSLLHLSQTYAHTTKTIQDATTQSPEHIIHVQHPEHPDAPEQTISFQMPEAEVDVAQIESAMERIVERQTTQQTTALERQHHQLETATQQQHLLRLKVEKELSETFQRLSELHTVDRAMEQIWQRETTLSPTLTNLFGQWYAQTITQSTKNYTHHQHLLKQITKTDGVFSHRIQPQPQSEEALLEQLDQTIAQSIHQHRDHTTQLDQSTEKLVNLVEQSYQNQIEHQITQNLDFQLQQENHTQVHQEQTLQWIEKGDVLPGQKLPEQAEVLPEDGQVSLTQVTNANGDHITKIDQVTEQLQQLQAQTDIHHQSKTQNQQVLEQQNLRTTYYQQITQEVERLTQEHTQRHDTIKEQLLWQAQAEGKHPQAQLPLDFVYPSQDSAYPSQDQAVEEPDFFVPEGISGEGDTQVNLTQMHQHQSQTQEEHYAQIAQSVQMIEQQNIERLQTLQAQEATEQKGFATPKADAMRTLTHAQKALEEPEAVEDLMGAPQVPTQPTMPPQLLKIIQQADPQQQALFQQIFQMGQSPQLRPQGMQPSDITALTLDIQRAEREWSEPAQMQHPAQEEDAFWQAEELAEVANIPLTQAYGQVAAVQGYGAKRGKTTKVIKSTMVHRQDTSFQTLLEEMEERYTQQVRAGQKTVQTLEQTNTQTIHTNQVNHQEVQHQVEDISNLVQTTLTGQMSYITDQVYQQMERRLEMERSRRGR